MSRLMIVCEYPTLLGGERSMLATLPIVAAAGFEVHVTGPPTGPLAMELQARGISHIAWKTHDEAGQRLQLPQLRCDLAALLRKLQPALLHANSLSTARIAGPVAADCSVRSIGHLRDILKLSPQAIRDLNAHRRLLAVSRATRDFHVAQGIVAAKCAVVHNGIDLTQFCPQSPTRYLHRELALPPQSRLIAIIGQLGLRKGTDVALTAASQLAKDFANVHWLVVGERTSNKNESHEYEQMLRSIADEQPLAGRVHFLGSRADVPRLMNECDLLVHSARQEPLSRVLLESAACGLAAIATDVGGTLEIFPNNSGSAVLIPPDNGSALAEAVRTLLLDDQRRKAIAKAARQRAESAFDLNHAATALLEQYRSVLN